MVNAVSDNPPVELERVRLSRTTFACGLRITEREVDRQALTLQGDGLGPATALGRQVGVDTDQPVGPSRPIVSVTPAPTPDVELEPPPVERQGRPARAGPVS